METEKGGGARMQGTNALKDSEIGTGGGKKRGVKGENAYLSCSKLMLHKKSWWLSKKGVGGEEKKI